MFLASLLSRNSISNLKTRTMKKQITNILFLTITVLLFTNCKKEELELKNHELDNLSEFKISEKSSQLSNDCVFYPLQYKEFWNEEYTSFQDSVSGRDLEISFTNNAPNYFYFNSYHFIIRRHVEEVFITLPQQASEVSILGYSFRRELPTLNAYDKDMNLLFSTQAENIYQYGFQTLTINDESGRIKSIGLANSHNRFRSIWSNLTVCYTSLCTEPTVSAEADITELWPANNKEVEIVFSGTLTNECENGTYALIDEYGEYSYSGEIVNGDYSIALNLMASRNGNDKDGRKYTFTVTTANESGDASDAVDVFVSHDQRKR